MTDQREAVIQVKGLKKNFGKSRDGLIKTK